MSESFGLTRNAPLAARRLDFTQRDPGIVDQEAAEEGASDSALM